MPPRFEVTGGFRNDISNIAKPSVGKEVGAISGDPMNGHGDHVIIYFHDPSTPNSIFGNERIVIGNYGEFAGFTINGDAHVLALGQWVTDIRWIHIILNTLFESGRRRRL